MQTTKTSTTAAAVHGSDGGGTAWCGRATAVDAPGAEVTCRRCLATTAARQARPGVAKRYCKRGHDQTLPGARYTKPSGGSMCAECRRIRAAARTAAKRAARADA